uniref:Prenyltransferase alpha-alpha toroid domain-containing protein n=1 Tax=Romanomermis culicivorax TaxID=13658 RepID=A0A915JRS1_ROMCU
MLDCIHFIDTPKAVAFTLSTQDAQIGGFGKYADVTPDLLHTYLSLAGLSILNMDGLRPLDPTLNITFRSLMRKSQNSIKANNHTNNLPASNAFTGHCI